MTHMDAQFPVSQLFCLTNTHRQTVKNSVISQVMYIGISVVFGLSNDQNHKVKYDNSVFCVSSVTHVCSVSATRKLLSVFDH